MKRGAFIAFEGLDGSGKTTQCRAICSKLNRMGFACKAEKEPTDQNPIGKLARDVIERRVNVAPHTLAMLMAADRYEHVLNDIKPRIEQGEHVLVDRFVFSSFAYQGLDCTFEEIYALNKRVLDLLMPDLTIFIDTPPEACLKRIHRSRGEMELFDAKGTAVRANFIEAFERVERANVLIVDGSQPVSEITREIWEAILPLCNSGGSNVGSKKYST